MEIVLPQTLPFIFGEVLFDCFPDGRDVPGGAPFNVAWNMQAFGQNPIFISRVGDDPHGQQIKETMTAWSMDTSHLQTDMSRPTGRVEISLDNGEPHFTILSDQAYDHIAPVVPPINEPPAFLYHGTLALRDDISRTTLARLKRETPCPIFLDINLRDPWWNKERTLSLIEDATWLKLNGDECKALFPNEGDFDTCGKMLLQKFNIEAVFITMGSKGAIAFLREKSPLTVKPAASVTVEDTVGAGDAFSSVLLLGMMRNWPLYRTMQRAQEFASGVVGQRGAITRNQSFYQSFCDKWELS